MMRGLGLLALLATPAAAQEAEARAADAAAQLDVIVALGRPGPGGVTLTEAVAEGDALRIRAAGDPSDPSAAGTAVDLLCATPAMAALLAAGGTGTIELRVGDAPPEITTC